MKKLISITIFILLTGCANTIHYHDEVPQNQLSFLETVSKNDSHITILRINSKKAGNGWSGSAGDYYVKYGDMNIFVQYHNNENLTIAQTSLSFKTLPQRTYKIFSTTNGADVTFSVTENGNLLTTKTVKLRSQNVHMNIPLYL